MLHSIGIRHGAAIVALILAALGFGLVTARVVAQGQSSAAAGAVVTVAGSGEALSLPDLVYLSVAVETRGTTLGEAIEQNNGKILSVVDALRTQGIAAVDIQTSGYTITPLYPQTPIGGMPSDATVSEPIGYQVYNPVTVALRDVETLSDLLEASLNAGANRIGQVRFTMRNVAALREQALSQAMSAARAKAEILAKDLGKRVGVATNVVEDSQGNTVGSPASVAAVARPASYIGGGPVIETGQIRVGAAVRVTFALE